MNLEQRIEEVFENTQNDEDLKARDLNPWEHLWFIEQSSLGVQAANEDLHKLIKILQEKYNIPQEEIFEIGKELFKTKYDIKLKHSDWEWQKKNFNQYE